MQKQIGGGGHVRCIFYKGTNLPLVIFSIMSNGFVSKFRTSPNRYQKNTS